MREGDWVSVAARLEEILSAHSGEEPFEEGYKLLVAKLAQEAAGEPWRVGVGERAPAAALDRWLAAAAARWPGLLAPRTRTALGRVELERLTALFDGLHLGAADGVGLDALFEQLVTRAAKGEKGQYFTPRHVVAEIVLMLEPRPGEQVVDPACGSGAFLFHAARGCSRLGLWGFDLDARAVRVARAMLVSAGRAPDDVQRVDSLQRRAEPGARRPPLEALVWARRPRWQGFDLLLTNPPFAGDVGAAFAGQYELGRHRRVERDALFVERCVELLRPGGRFALVLPHNKLGGARWAFLRQWLLERTRLVAVLGLGRHTFLPHTSQKACVVIGVKRRRPRPPEPSEEILFFVSERDGKDARGRLLLRPSGGGVDHDLGEAVAPVRERLAALRREEG